MVIDEVEVESFEDGEAEELCGSISGLFKIGASKFKEDEGNICDVAIFQSFKDV